MTNNDRNWMMRAACAGMGSALDDPFFPQPKDHHGQQRAASICASCPVADVCDVYGKREPHGVWGGTYRNQEVASGNPDRPYRVYGRQQSSSA